MTTIASERLARTPQQPTDAPTWTALFRVFEFRVLEYRRTFRASIFASFISPALFLTAMGIGLGGYVNGASSQSFEGGTYLAFLAPGLLAAALMQTASGEAMFPIIGGLVVDE